MARPLLRGFQRWIALDFDVRPGEARLALGGFAVILLSIIAGHTALESARDALLLTGPGPRALGLVYILIASCTVPGASLVGWAGQRFGARRTLIGSLVLAAAVPSLLFGSPAKPWSAIAVYVTSGVIGSILVPQFWTLVAGVLTVAQGRRLFGLISVAGVLGGVIGSGLAAAILTYLPARSLLLLSAGLFLLTALRVATIQEGPAAPAVRVTDAPVPGVLRTFREQPYLWRVAQIVVFSTATLLLVDYLFKSTIAREIPAGQVGPRIAGYYLVFNVMSLVVQVFVGTAVVERVGVTAALALTPTLILLGAGGAVMSAGAVAAVLLLKGIDGSLRYSLHRITGELTYLPLPASVRARAKPLIDGALGRAAQTLTGAGLLALSGTGLLWPRPLAVLVACGAAAWLAATFATRGPYVDLLRRAIARRPSAAEGSPALDGETADYLVQRLAADDPLEVLAAMEALVRRGRDGLIPALVLGIEDDAVVTRALEIFGASERTDWIPYAVRALHHPRTRVRLTAARVLARHDRLEIELLANDSRARVQGYAAVVGAEAAGDPLEDRSVARLVKVEGEEGRAARCGMLAAAGDVPPSERLRRLVEMLGETRIDSTEEVELLAQAAAHQGATGLIPKLISLLPIRAAREALRTALVALGAPAFDQLSAALADPSRPRALRVHLPKTLGRFGDERASRCLLDCIEREDDGLVRHKAVRALGLVSRRVPAERSRTERLCVANLVSHFRLLTVHVVLQRESRADGGAPAPSEKLLFGLLEDKRRHALDRAFRLLQAAHPDEDTHRIHLACSSDDRYARANAGELLDALLRRADQQRLRELFRLAADDLPDAERARRFAVLCEEELPGTAADALALLRASPDPMMATLAGLYASEHAGVDRRDSRAEDGAVEHATEGALDA